MATTTTIGEFGSLWASFFDRKLIGRIEAGIDGGVFIDEVANFIDTPTAQEEPMPEILPKEILVHLEKADRSEEWIEPRSRQEGIWADPVNMMMSNDFARMQQLDQFRNDIGRIGMASSSLVGIGQANQRRNR